MTYLLGVECFDELDPPRRAAGYHGKLPLMGESMNQLVGFLHNGQVGCKLGVEHLVESQGPEGTDHLAGHQASLSQAHRLSEPYPDGGCGLHQNHQRGVFKCIKDLLDVAFLCNGCGRADKRALSAIGAD